MEPNTIIIIVGFTTIFIERVFTWMMRIKKSDCCGAHLEMRETQEKK